MVSARTAEFARRKFDARNVTNATFHCREHWECCSISKKSVRRIQFVHSVWLLRAVIGKLCPVSPVMSSAAPAKLPLAVKTQSQCKALVSEFWRTERDSTRGLHTHRWFCASKFWRAQCDKRNLPLSWALGMLFNVLKISQNNPICSQRLTSEGSVWKIMPCFSSNIQRSAC